MGKREMVALLNLSSWCLVMVERLFLAVPWGCMRFVIVVFPDHTHLLFLTQNHHLDKLDRVHIPIHGRIKKFPSGDFLYLLFVVCCLF